MQEVRDGGEVIPLVVDRELASRRHEQHGRHEEAGEHDGADQGANPQRAVRHDVSRARVGTCASLIEHAIV